MFSRLLTAASAVLLFGTAAIAADYYGVAAGKSLYRFDSLTGQTSLVGTYLTTDPKEKEIYDLARAPDSTLFGLSSGQSGPVVVPVFSRIYRIDEQTALATEVANVGAIPVGGLAIDPTDGSFYYIALGSGPYGPWGPENELYRLDLAGSGTPQYLGDLPISFGQFRDLAFDPAGQLYSLNLNPSLAMLWRIDKANPTSPGTGPVGTGLGGSINLASGAMLAETGVTGKLLGYEYANRLTFTIDLVTGLGTPVTYVQPPVFLDIVVDGCAGSAKVIGAGCPGAGGLVPALAVTGCPQIGQQVNIEIQNGLGGATAFLFVGPASAPVPLGFGCTLYVWPVLPQMLVLPLGGAGPGAGGLTLPVLIPPVAAGALAFIQAFVIDPASPIGAAAANAVALSIP